MNNKLQYALFAFIFFNTSLLLGVKKNSLGARVVIEGMPFNQKGMRGNTNIRYCSACHQEIGFNKHTCPVSFCRSCRKPVHKDLLKKHECTQKKG